MDVTSVLVGAVIAAAALVFLYRFARRGEAPSPDKAPAVPIPPRSNRVAGGSHHGQPLVQWLLARASEQTGFSVAEDPLARRRIEDAAANALNELEAKGSATISVPYLLADARGPKHFTIEVRRKPDRTFEAEG